MFFALFVVGKGDASQAGACVVSFPCMLTEYLRLAMSRAHYELLGGGEGFYGEIPGFQGVLAQAETLEACREELASTLEDWLLFRVSRHLPVQHL